jgi:hypothetical protein
VRVQPVPDKNWDVRPHDKFVREEEHFQLGNISRRVNLIKVILNTELQADPDAVGAKSQLVHHSDEVGNPDALLAKPLLDCLPIIAFVPGEQDAYTMETMMDIQSFVTMLKVGGFAPAAQARLARRSGPVTRAVAREKKLPTGCRTGPPPIVAPIEGPAGPGPQDRAQEEQRCDSSAFSPTSPTPRRPPPS